MKKRILILLPILIIIISIVLFLIFKKDAPIEEEKETEIIEKIDEKNTNTTIIEKFNKDFDDYKFEKNANIYTAENIKLDELFSAFYYEFFEEEYEFSTYNYDDEKNINFYTFTNKTKYVDPKVMTIKEENNKFIIELVD